MASLTAYTTKQGKRWRVRWRSTEGQKSVTFTDHPDDLFDAQQLVAGLRKLEMRKQPGYELDVFAEQFMETLRARKDAPETVGEALDAFGAEKKETWAKATYDRAFVPQRNSLKPLDSRLLATLTVGEVEKHLKTLKHPKTKKPYPVMAAKSLGLLKVALRDAVRRGQTVDPGLFQIQAPQHRPRRMFALTWEQVNELAGQCSEPNAIWLFAYTGLRISELVALTDGDVGPELEWLEVGASKTEAGVRRVYLPDAAKKVLRRQLLERVPSRFVFPNSRGEGWTPGGFRNTVFNPAAKRVKFGRVTPHYLRCTNATWRMDAGTPDHELGDVMGWTAKTVAAMRQTYVQARDDHRVSAANRLDSLLGAGGQIREAK